MRVSIWDLDYYYSKTKKDCLNSDVMRISSYHKQKGDQINFILTQDDIDRPHDLYYIIKEHEETPNPPVRFFLLSSVRWWGTAYKARIRWKMPPAMLACRPDYLLYPEKNTIAERSEYIRLLDDQLNLLPLTQDYTNSFKNKATYISDRYLWLADKKVLCSALERVKDVKNLCFLHPIRIDLIIHDKDVRDRFLTLKLSRRSKITWDTITAADAKESIDFKELVEATHPTTHTGNIRLKLNGAKHWEDVRFAQRDFQDCKALILYAKRHHQTLEVVRLKQRLDSPYFFFFEELSKWTAGSFARDAWIQYLSAEYPQCDIGNPASWTWPYRQLLFTTWDDADFMLTIDDTKRLSDSRVPWALLKQEFQWGI